MAAEPPRDDAPGVGVGCLRLAAGALADDEAVAVLVAAIDAGVGWIDTADVYGPPERPTRGEALAARARAARPAASVRWVSKGGLVRPAGAWVPDGRASHLAAAARASRARLGVERLDVHLLHAVDPRVELATSVRALARLVDDGVAAAVGLANVHRAQLEAACALAPVTALSIELGPHRPDGLRDGLVAWCRARGIAVLAHRPLGGPAGARKLARDVGLAALAARHDVDPIGLTLAWLRGHGVTPLVGASTVEHARAAGHAARATLAADVVAELDARWLGRGPRAAATGDGELVILMGPPAAGKSTLAGELVARGYHRLNRDLRGGTLAGLAGELDRVVARGTRRVVLDNTYGTRASRAAVVEVGARHGVPVRCLWLDTSLEDAQVNAAARLLAVHGRLPEPDELPRLARRDPGAFAPSAQLGYRRRFEPPGDDEGFVAIERREFVRAPTGGAPALVVDLDDLVRVGRPTTAEAVRLADGAAEALAAWRAAGWRVVGTAWSPDLGGVDRDARVAAIDARTAELAGAPMPIATCTHPGGPPRCWCRPPLPGLALVLARAHGLDLTRSLHVGRGPSARGLAARLGMAYLETDGPLPPPVAAPTG